MYSSLLKRCPFCGSFIEMAVYTSCDDEEDKNYGFFCNHCGVHIDFEEKLTYDSDRAEQCKQEATAAWNRRTEEQETERMWRQRDGRDSRGA